MTYNWTDHVKTIRNRLGIGLRESMDFYQKNPNDWEHRLEAMVQRQNENGYNWITDRDKVLAALKTFHEQTPSVGKEQACDTLIRTLEEKFGIRYEQGA